ncbi:MAG: hypothetical protein O7C58_07020, partial [Rickettsia endosymbiont of Ixodes persulcatus]|nr:hypothetical protein [Rickettsia endosymbiont of Ixodes persulcatus]
RLSRSHAKLLNLGQCSLRYTAAQNNRTARAMISSGCMRAARALGTDTCDVTAPRACAARLSRSHAKLLNLGQCSLRYTAAQNNRTARAMISSGCMRAARALGTDINFLQIANIITQNNNHIEFMQEIKNNEEYSFITNLTDKNNLQSFLIP